ncbi:MAG: isopentenyl phosphate kinase [Haloarculaceae archaeon]
MTVVLKLGGSVITEKDALETIDERALAAAADAVADAIADGLDDLVVVHGAGSFGHPHAARHGASSTDGIRDAAGAVEIHDAMYRLDVAVLERLHDRGVDALPIRPLSVAHRDAGGRVHCPTGAVAAMLAEGFVPVLHGDVVVHEGRGVTILSGDDLVATLADRLGADRVGLCSTVPGVLDANGAVVPEIERFADVADALGGSDATDVTGGMAAKVRTLLSLDAPASVFGPDDLAAFLAGETPGTTVRGYSDGRTD